jgi:hypothetical protein
MASDLFFMRVLCSFFFFLCVIAWILACCCRSKSAVSQFFLAGDRRSKSGAMRAGMHRSANEGTAPRQDVGGHQRDILPQCDKKTPEGGASCHRSFPLEISTLKFVFSDLNLNSRPCASRWNTEIIFFAKACY